MKELHLLNLGAGVQSSVLYVMAVEKELYLDAAIFADTGEEPQAVYAHLERLKAMGGPTIYIRTAGRLGDDLVKGQHSRGQRFATIPAFTCAQEGTPLGITRRQCTAEYKINVVDKCIRRELLKLEPYQRIPSDVTVWQYFGFSFDEPGRAARTRKRETARFKFRFPLIDEQMTRGDCLRYLDARNIKAARSACVFCPYRSNREWRHLKETDPAGWARAIEIDNALRVPGNVLNRNLNQKLYVHATCVPLERANLEQDQKSLFDLDCEGGCGL